jgi:hypothetical protein
MNQSALDQAVGCLYRNTYYCALPLDGSEKNNAVLMFNTLERTWLLRESVQVESFLSTESGLFFTSVSTPGRIWRWREDSWEEGHPVPMSWVGGWQDFGHKNIAKGSFTVYLTVDCTEPVELKLSIQTEKKMKTKTLIFNPPLNGQLAKQRRVVFGGNGRRFRVFIESNEKTIPWRLIGGVQLEAETDTD